MDAPSSSRRLASSSTMVDSQPLSLALAPEPRKPPSPEDYIRIAQEYSLPNAIKLKLDADVQQAQSIAIVMALFAGALITLAQILGGLQSWEDEPTKSWGAFRIFMWSSIIFDLGESFVCIMAINMCTTLPVIAQQTLVLASNPSIVAESKPESGIGGSPTLQANRISSRYPLDLNHPVCVAARNEPLPPQLLMNHYLLLEAFGMHRGYRLVDRLVIWVMVFSSFISFVTLFFWTAHTQKILTAGLIWTFSFIIVIIVLITFAIARGAGRKWR